LALPQGVEERKVTAGAGGCKVALKLPGNSGAATSGWGAARAKIILNVRREKPICHEMK